LAIGGGVNIEVATGHLSNAVDFGTIGALNGLGPFGLLPGKADGSATVKGNDVAAGWNLGLLYQPMPALRIGLTYRSAIYHDLTGSVTYSGVPAPLAGAFVSQAASTKLPDPATASLSGAWDIGDFTLLGSVTYTGWSIVHNLSVYTGSTVISTVPQNYRDTVSVAVGADYRLNDKVTLRAGTMFDPTPVPSSYLSPRLPDANRYWLSVGATYRPVPNLALTAAYSHVFAPNATVALTDAGPGTANFTRGNLNATYSLSFDIFSLDATLKF
jgi:long-chain fatty acid transport protein